MAEKILKNDSEKFIVSPTECFSECCKKYFKLGKSDALSRRNAIKEIHNYILVCEADLFHKSNLNTLLDSLAQHLIVSLSDESEKTRELSVTILKIIFSGLSAGSDTLDDLFKALANRLGKTDERERSEEVRILELELTILVIEKTNCSLMAYLHDIAGIINACLMDDCPEIKRKSCECLSLLASKEESHFHMVGGTFLTPLLATITHQHMKTRNMCINALGKILDYLNNDEFVKATIYLAQRLFDHSPSVRLAVTEVVGSMLLGLKDRYSYFPRLIPMMLSILYDEVFDVRSKGEELWQRAGIQYIKENEKDYKDLIDFPQDLPKNYPEDAYRPPIGCRILVQRNLHKMFPPLLTELTDWNVNVRVKCSKVFYSIILHSENKITAYLSAVFAGIAHCSNDQECVKMAIKISNLLGCFVDPSMLCDSLMALLHKTPSASGLRIFASTLAGFKGRFSRECFRQICKFLASPSICWLKQEAEQILLLKCIEALLCLEEEIDLGCSEFMFIVLVSVGALKKNSSILNQISDILRKLASIQSTSVGTVFQQHSVSYMRTIISNHELWDFESPELSIFRFILWSGYLKAEAVKFGFPILTKNLHPSKDVKIRKFLLPAVDKIFDSLSPTDYELVSDDIFILIRSGIFPNLTWSAGTTAAKIRTLAAASLYGIVEKNFLCSKLLERLGDELLPILATLSKDDETMARLLSCKILVSILPVINGCIDDQKIHNTCFQLLSCMDDESEDVRLMTVKVLKAYVKSFPSDYDWNLYKAHVKHIYENVLVHMDDKNEKIRQSVLNLLKDIGFAAPDVLLDEVESKRYVMSANDLCESLIEHIKNIKTY